MFRKFPSLFKKTFPIFSKFSFASKILIEKSKEAQKNLLSSLKKELEFEQNKNFEDNSINKTLHELEFEFYDNKEDKLMQLKKTSDDDYILLITFESRNPTKEKDDEEEEEEKEKENNEQNAEENEENEQMCFFTAYAIFKNKNYWSLMFECYSIDSEIHIDYMGFLKDYRKYMEISRYQKVTKKMFGHKFDRLSEKTQNELIQFLRKLGLSTDVAILIEHLSLVKEQKLYENWLRNLIEALKK